MNLSKFSSQALSKAEMKLVAGGYPWCYSYDCGCGSTMYSGWGTLAAYTADAQAHCQPGQPVNCYFTGLPAGSCGA